MPRTTRRVAPARRRAPVRRRFVRRTKRVMRRRPNMGAISRFGLKGSIKSHSFVDRGLGLPLWYATTSTATGPPITYTVGWNTFTFSNSIASASTPITGQCICIQPTATMSPVYTANAVNYNWARLGKLTFELSPVQNAMQGNTTPASSLANGEFILSNTHIPMEFMPPASGTATSTFSGAVGSVVGNAAYLLYNYQTFQDDPNTKRKPILKKDYICKHKYIMSPKVATPHFLGTTSSGTTIQPENNWNMAYTYKKAPKMSVLNASTYNYPGIVIYIPYAPSGWVPNYALNWTFEFTLIDPN